VAISVLENLGEEAASIPVQIFATDVSEASIDRARVGVYPQTIAADVSPERLRRFFSKSDGNYRITKVVRDLCVLRPSGPDPRPAVLQARPRPLPQRAHLSRSGAAAKAAERLPLFAAAFRLPDARPRRDDRALHQPIRDRQQAPPHLSKEGGRTGQHDRLAVGLRRRPRSGRGTQAASPPASTSFQGSAQRLLLERFAPPGVVVDDELRIVQFIGHTGRYLEPAPGDANLTLPKMVREGLLHGLRTAFQQARREGARRGGAGCTFVSTATTSR
jgi:two-component system CheB/CheR fusion protein